MRLNAWRFRVRSLTADCRQLHPVTYLGCRGVLGHGPFGRKYSVLAIGKKGKRFGTRTIGQIKFGHIWKNTKYATHSFVLICIVVDFFDIVVVVSFVVSVVVVFVVVVFVVALVVVVIVGAVYVVVFVDFVVVVYHFRCRRRCCCCCCGCCCCCCCCCWWWYYSVVYLGFQKGGKFSLATSAHTRGGGGQTKFSNFFSMSKKNLFGQRGAMAQWPPP